MRDYWRRRWGYCNAVLQWGALVVVLDWAGLVFDGQVAG